jgi:hypothetical protein
MLTKWQRDLRAVPEARVVELPGANLYMFLSNEAPIPSFGNSIPHGIGMKKPRSRSSSAMPWRRVAP